MKLLAHAPLKPLDLSRPHRAGAAPTHLSPSDLRGVVSHPKRDRSDGSALHPTTPANQHDRLVDQTRRWVAQTFFGTLLKQMHESHFKSKMFEGGRGGEAFGQMYDQRLVEHMSHASGNKLVGSIVRRIEAKNARAAYERQGAAPVRGAAGAPGGGSTPGGGNPPHDPPPRHGGGDNPYRNVRIHVAPGL